MLSCEAMLSKIIRPEFDALRRPSAMIGRDAPCRKPPQPLVRADLCRLRSVDGTMKKTTNSDARPAVRKGEKRHDFARVRLSRIACAQFRVLLVGRSSSRARGRLPDTSGTLDRALSAGRFNGHRGASDRTMAL